MRNLIKFLKEFKQPTLKYLKDQFLKILFIHL